MRIHVNEVREIWLGDENKRYIVMHELDIMCGGKDTWLDEKTGHIMVWEDTGHGSGLTSILTKKPTELQVSAHNTRRIMKANELARINQRTNGK